jgi:hypothetical protein
MDMLFENQYHNLNLLIDSKYCMIDDDHHHQERHQNYQNVRLNNKDIMNDDNHNHQITIKLFDQQSHNPHPNHMILQVNKKFDPTDDNYLR